MSRKSRRAKALATPTAPSVAGAGADVAAFSPYLATQESPSRGRMWTFGEDTRRQLDPWARTVLMLKSRTLVENFGPAKALRHLASLIGALKPQANSGDTAWDALAEARFDAITNSPLIFDAGGRHTFATWQKNVIFRQFVDGDAFSVLTETTSGAARIAGREAHQVCGSENPWRDGVMTDANGFPLAYRFTTDPGSGKSTILPVMNVHHHASFGTLGGTRGTPALAHFINHGHDILETNGFVKAAIKLAATIGLTRRADAGHGINPSALGLGAPAAAAPFQSANAATGLPQTTQLRVEDIFSGSLVSSVPLDTLHDDRPGPNFQSFKESLMRECAQGLGVAPAILFFMDDPGGANGRVQVDMFARFVAAQHAEFLLPFCQRFWTYAIAKEMKQGRLPYPSKGEFWRVRWTPPRSLTADMGRMGRLAIEMRKALMTSFSRHYEELGLHYEEELEQCAREQRQLIDLEAKYGLPPGSLSQGLLPPNAQPLVQEQEGSSQETGSDDETKAELAAIREQLALIVSRQRSAA